MNCWRMVAIKETLQVKRVARYFLKLITNTHYFLGFLRTVIKIPLSSTSDGIVECVGPGRIVRQPLSIRLLGIWPDEFRIVAEDSKGYSFSISCPTGEVSYSSHNKPNAECIDGEVVFTTFDWEELPISIIELHLDQNVYYLQTSPTYITEYFPTKSCYEIDRGTKSLNGSAIIQLPLK